MCVDFIIIKSKSIFFKEEINDNINIFPHFPILSQFCRMESLSISFSFFIE